jgi:hypothetical protein
MKNKEHRRIVPISVVTLVALVILAVFEGLMIGGVVRVKSTTVAKWAPWAYEPFLRLIGEHPDALRQKEASTKVPAPEPELTGLDEITGFSSESIGLESNDVPAIAPPEVVEQIEPEVYEPPTNSAGKVIPVG